MKNQRKKELIARYWWLGGSGAVLMGSGLSVVLEGTRLRDQRDRTWFWVSTGGFALFFAGMSLIGDANRFRTLADVPDKRNRK